MGDILTSIADFGALSDFLDNSGSQLSTFFSAVEEEKFSFSGASLCGTEGACEGNLRCTEVLEGVTITCVSTCKLGYCVNNGTCEQSDPNVTPICTCPSASSSWYLGARCETFVALWMIITGAVCCLIIIISAIIISCWIYNMKRSKKEKLALAEYPNGVSNNAFVGDDNVTILPVAMVSKQSVTNEKELKPVITVGDKLSTM